MKYREIINGRIRRRLRLTIAARSKYTRICKAFDEMMRLVAKTNHDVYEKVFKTVGDPLMKTCALDMLTISHISTHQVTKMVFDRE